MPTLKPLLKKLAVASFAAAAILSPVIVFAQAGFSTSGPDPFNPSRNTPAQNAALTASRSASAATPATPATNGSATTPTPPGDTGKSTECESGYITCGILTAFQAASIWIGYLIGVVAAFFISIASSLIQVIIDMSSKVISNPLVTEGFKISLSIANLGFVLAIIVIAFTTMLRISGYETKKMLRNLVLAAVLVNFSFLIAGSIIDFGNVFGNFFLSAVSPQSGNFSRFADNLANSLNVQKLSGVTPLDPQSTQGALVSFGAAYISLFASTAAIAIFSIFLIIIFFALAFMLLTRYIYIIFLLILMPMAWLSWIFPGFSKYFSQWWEQFIKWTLFYPAVTFFMYLAILSSQKVGALVQTSMTASGLPSTQSAATIANISTNTVVAFLQVIVQVAILLGGLVAANKLGIEGASTALGYAGKVKSWAIGATGKAARLPLTGARAAAEYAGTRPTKFGARMLSGALQSRAGRWIPGAQSAAANLAALGSRKEEVEGYQKQYLAHLTKDQFENMQKHPPVGPVARAAILAESAKRNAIGSLTEKVPSLPVGRPPTAAETEDRERVEKRNTAALQMYVQAAKDTNPGVAIGEISSIKEVLNVNPEFVEKLSIPRKPEDGGGFVSIEDIVKKIRADKAADISKDALKNPKVVMALNQSQVSSIYRGASGAHIENMKKALEDIVRSGGTSSALEGATEDVIKFKQDVEDAKDTGEDDATIKSLKHIVGDAMKKQKDALKAASQEQRDAFEKLKVMKQRVGNPNP